MFLAPNRNKHPIRMDDWSWDDTKRQGVDHANTDLLSNEQWKDIDRPCMKNGGSMPAPMNASGLSFTD
jgi:hypothetical protein